ncbi:hypothetical protein LguiB_031146 [Lonicera macranthoides]
MDMYGLSAPDMFRIDKLLDFSNDEIFSSTATTTDSYNHHYHQHHLPSSENTTGVRLLEVNEEPTIDPRDGEIGIYHVLFEQTGLKLPLDPLLCDVLRQCNMRVRILDYPRAVHNLLGYTPWDTDFLSERCNQPDWVGNTKRPSKLEDRQKIKVRPVSRPIILTRIMIREWPVERTCVTTTGLVADLGGPSTSAPCEGMGKRKAVEPSHSSSDTPTDPDLVQLY